MSSDFTSLGISLREFRLAQSVAHRLPRAFLRRRLIPAFSSFNLTRVSDLTLFIAVLDTSRIGDHRPYSGDLLHQISTDLSGLPVYLSNSTGIRYVVLLSQPPRLPHKIDLPPDGASHGWAALGVRFTGQPVLLDWSKTPHIAVLGQTGSGKSVFLQSLAYQAIRDGMQLMISDLDQTTFGMLEGHPALRQPIASSSQATYELVERALAECDQRAALYKTLPESPQNIGEYNALAIKKNLEPLAHILVILDEASSVLAALGGAKSQMGQALATLGWRGRKFGLHFVFAAQQFTKDLIGPVRDQVSLSICFRVRNAEMAKRMGCQGAERIPESRPGLAITDRFGPMQAYSLDKSLLMQGDGLQISLTEIEQALFGRALAEGGKLTLSNIQAWSGATEWQSRKWLDAWALKGWVAKDPERGNAFCITGKTDVLLSNHQTTQSSSNLLKPAGEALKPVSSPLQPGFEALKPSPTGLRTLAKA